MEFPRELVLSRGPHDPRELIMSPIAREEEASSAWADYAELAWQYRWLVGGLMLAGGILAALWSVAQTPIYQSKATLVIEQAGPGAFDRDRHFNDTSPEYYQTHFELMKSHEVLLRTARRLNLAASAEYGTPPESAATSSFFTRFVPQQVRAWWGSLAAAPAAEPAESEERLLNRFTQNLEVMPVRGARLAHITATSKDPAFAALAANTLASVYIERTQELTATSKEKSAQWFMSHLDELRNRVTASQRALYEFRNKHGLLGERERQPVVAHNLVELNSELVRAEMRKAEAATRFNQIQTLLHHRTPDGHLNWDSLDGSTEILNAPLIQTLRAQEITASRELLELSEKYGPLHPKLARAKSELELLHAKIQEQIQKIVDSLKREYDVAVAKERATREAVNRYKKEKTSTDQQYESDHAMLEREAESSQHLYDIFLKATKETDVTAGMRSGNVYLADPAVPAVAPVRPRKTLNTMLGMLMGMLSGIVLAFVAEARDRSFKKADDVERYIPGLAVLGSIPLAPQADLAQSALVPTAQPLSPISESVRAIRTSVLLSNSMQPTSSLLVTSPGENEGKTTLAVNLAIAMARLDNTRVVLIDGDLRKSLTHPLFNVRNGQGPPHGLAHFLMGACSDREILYTTDLPNLSVVPRGATPTNPSELLHTKHMSDLIRRYQAAGYHVIVDTPPALLVTDPVVLAPQVDGILVVVSAGHTSRQACRTVVRRLTGSGGRVLGVVLQKATVTDVPYHAYQSAYART